MHTLREPLRQPRDTSVARTATRSPAWVSVVLAGAGIYNLVWGAAVVLFPAAWFQTLGIDLASGGAATSVALAIVLWQCLGMVVGVYGVGYLIAATDPSRHWLILLVGLLGKTFGPVGFLWSAGGGQIPWSFGWIILCNDALWWLPFAASLWRVARKPHVASDFR